MSYTCTFSLNRSPKVKKKRRRRRKKKQHRNEALPPQPSPAARARGNPSDDIIGPATGILYTVYTIKKYEALPNSSPPLSFLLCNS